jgi:ABC-type transport system substrate-binding protein
VAVAAAACTVEQPVSDTLASLTVGVAAPVITESSTPVALQYHHDALTRETLVALGSDGRPAPRVIESWQVSPDGLTWRLKIAAGIRFHDSTPVTATELAPQVRALLWAGRLGKITAVEAQGSDVLVVNLRERFAFLPEDLGQATAVRTVTETDDQDKKTTKSFGTGPYVVVSESSEALRLRKFPNHYRGDPGVAEIEIRLFPDQRNAWSALMRDKIDVLYEVSRESLHFVRSESTVNVATFPRAYVYLLGFNSRLPSLARSEVRRALNHALDRDAFVKQALAGEGEPASGHVWPRHWAFDSSVKPLPHNPAEATRLMEAQGLKLQTTPGRMPARLRLRCLVYEPFRQMALVVQRQLAEVQVDLELEVLGGQEYVRRVTSGNFETFIFEMTSGRTLMWPYLFWHSSSPLLKSGYRGADDVLDRMRMTTNDEEMRAATSDFQKRLVEDPPAAFLAWGRVSRAVTRRFEIPTTGDEIYGTIAHWKPAPGRRGAIRP